MSLVITIAVTTFDIVPRTSVFTTVLVYHNISEAPPPGGKQQHKHHVLVSTICCSLGLYITSSLYNTARDNTTNIQIYFVMNPNHRP